MFYCMFSFHFIPLPISLCSILSLSPLHTRFWLNWQIACDIVFFLFIHRERQKKHTHNQPTCSRFVLFATTAALNWIKNYIKIWIESERYEIERELGLNIFVLHWQFMGSARFCWQFVTRLIISTSTLCILNSIYGILFGISVGDLMFCLVILSLLNWHPMKL